MLDLVHFVSICLTDLVSELEDLIWFDSIIDKVEISRPRIKNKN